MKPNKSSLQKIFLCVSISFSLAACGSETELDQGKQAEKLGRYRTAISHYENFWKLNSNDPDAPEAIYRIGEIYRTVMVDLGKARKNFQNVTEWYPKSSWAKKADFSLINSPDYFPFEKIIRVMGDSQSGGKNMKLIDNLKPNSNDPRLLTIQRQIFAGNTKVSETKLHYEKRNAGLHEKTKQESSGYELLKFPAEKNKGWVTKKSGRPTQFKIISTNAKVKVKAGVYVSCLKVKEIDPRIKRSWRIHYFAPGVGPVLISQATSKKETKITELLSFKKQ